ncbi:MAG: hypothetical protein ACK6DA_16260 [Candidatus Kapaibacterium sp.]|jgi:hypothetical protein
MTLVSNLKKAVDLPVWEWTRFSPVAPTAGLSCSCTADNNIINETNGRYIYYLINATNFWRYDTFSDSYMQLPTPPQAPLTASTMRFAGALGYHNRVLSATSNTIRTGLPTGKSAIGFKIRIVSGTGAGQERIITDVSEPIVADFGVATAGATTSLTDGSKNWYGSSTASDAANTEAYTGTTPNFNGWAGYVVRTTSFGTGPNQVRKILYNTNQVLTIGDVNINAYEPFSNTTWVAPAAGTVYQIESSTLTVDTAWDTQPDQTSRFIIRSGAVLLVSGAAATPFHTIQYYCVLADMWHTLPAIQNTILIAPTDNSLERTTENSSIWYRGIATGGSTTTLVDTSANWTKDEWAGYELFIFSGTGRGQEVEIISNTNTTLTFAAIATAPDVTSRYEILGFDAGTSTGSNAYNTLIDSGKSWTTNRWKNLAVRIVYGKGAGQMRRILSNTATTLTLYRGWNVTPDNTSVYSIQGDSETMHINWGASAQHFQFSTMGGINMMHLGRSRDIGVANVLAALRCDSSHNITDELPIALTSLSGTATITATSTQPHCLKVGDYVSIRGVTSAAADQYNVTGLVQVLSVPSTTTFTYTPAANGSGTYAYFTALGTNNLSDASKDFRDNISSATTTSLTFTRATPSNINGWYVTGTNITPGTRVTSGAGTVTLTIPTQGGTPTGVVTFSPWGPTTAVTSTGTAAGGAGVATITMSASTNGNINGWLISGANIPADTFVVSGAGTTTLVLSRAMTGAATATTYTFYPPEVAGRVFIIATAAPAATTGSTTSQIFSGISPVGGTIGFLGGAITLPVAAVSRYIVTDIPIIGAQSEGNAAQQYFYGVATGGTTTTLVDAGAFWATATGSQPLGQAATITLSAASPGNVNGWFITGTGIATGTRIISGQGTTTLTLSQPTTGAVSGTMTCCAWGPSGGSSYLVGKRIRVITGTGSNQELIITAVAPGTGTITFATATAPAANSIYTIVSTPLKGAGIELSWVYGNSGVHSEDRGRYLWSARGNGVVGIDKIDLNTDLITYVHTAPFTETLTTGSYYAYDGLNSIWFTKDATQRVYRLDVNTGYVYGGGTIPYVAGTAQIGNKMEIFTTADRLSYLWVNRHGNTEHFRALLYHY